MSDVFIKKAELSMLFDIVKLDTSVCSQNREHIIRNSIENGQCYVLETGNRIAAYGIMDYNFYERGFISLIIVGMEHRRRGFGKQLVNTFIDQCKTDKLFTSTNKSNLPMQRLLETCGFTRCGMIDELDEGDPEIVFCYKRGLGK